jgi:hypothetical protein
MVLISIREVLAIAAKAVYRPSVDHDLEHMASRMIAVVRNVLHSAMPMNTAQHEGMTASGGAERRNP